MQDGEFERRLREDLPRGLAKPLLSRKERGVHARWLQPDEFDGRGWVTGDGLMPDALMLGRRGGRVIGWKDDRHMTLIAGSRSGKGVSLIIPNLLSYEGSALVIDPKGENAQWTAARRGKGAGPESGNGLGQDVYVLDPFGVSGQPTASFNPLAELNPRSEDVAEDAALFADALITHPDHGERHWTESAQSLLRALILVALRDPLPARRNLVTVRQLLMLTDKSIRDVEFEARQRGNKIGKQDALIEILRAQARKPFGYICAGVAEQLAGMGENERGSVLSTAKTQTQWLDDRRIQKVLRGSDFRMADLKRKRTTVYLCLPAMRMGTHSRWLRLIILYALSVMERTAIKAALPVLFVLDEFPVLGHMRPIEMAAGLMAGFGVKLWVIAQNIGQLKEHYPKNWQTFFGNSGMAVAFGNNDSETLKEMSEILGNTDIDDEQPSGAARRQLLEGAAATRDVRREVALLAPNELRSHFSKVQDRALLITMEHPPAVVERFIYYEDPLFKGLYDESPYRQIRRRRRLR